MAFRINLVICSNNDNSTRTCEFSAAQMYMLRRRPFRSTAGTPQGPNVWCTPVLKVCSGAATRAVEKRKPTRMINARLSSDADAAGGSVWALRPPAEKRTEMPCAASARNTASVDLTVVGVAGGGGKPAAPSNTPPTKNAACINSSIPGTGSSCAATKVRRLRQNVSCCTSCPTARPIAMRRTPQ